jgi:hypothetical protein
MKDKVVNIRTKEAQEEGRHVTQWAIGKVKRSVYLDETASGRIYPCPLCEVVDDFAGHPFWLFTEDSKGVKRAVCPECMAKQEPSSLRLLDFYNPLLFEWLEKAGKKNESVHEKTREHFHLMLGKQTAIIYKLEGDIRNLKTRLERVKAGKPEYPDQDTPW